MATDRTPPHGLRQQAGDPELTADDAAMVAEPPQLYLRRCNNQPRKGMPVSRGGVEDILAHLRRTAVIAISGDLDRGLAVRVAAGTQFSTQAPGLGERTFTFKPVATGQHRGPAEPD